jgi:hypothetical protein
MGKRFGKASFESGGQRYVCDWILHEDGSFTVSVLPHSGRFVMRRVFDVASHEDLDRLARMIASDLTGSVRLTPRADE